MMSMHRRMSAKRAAVAASQDDAECLLRAANEGDPNTLDFNRFGDGQRILEFDAQVPDCAVHLGVTEKKLNSSKVAG